MVVCGGWGGGLVVSTVSTSPSQMERRPIQALWARHSARLMQYTAPPHAIHVLTSVLHRSVIEGSTRNASTMSIMMLARGKTAGAGGVIRAQIPYIKADFPIFILFRALGFVVSDCVLNASHNSLLYWL